MGEVLDLLQLPSAWAEALAGPAARVQAAALTLPTRGLVGYYLDPVEPKSALMLTDQDDFPAAAGVLARAGFGPPADVLTEEAAGEGNWVKVSWSSPGRAIGEALNFFPGQYPWGADNHAGPVAALATSGLLGAGLGWGAGRLAKAVMPEGYGDHLPRSGLLLGGAIGAGVGSTPGLVNWLTGREFNAPDPLGGAEPNGPDYGGVGYGLDGPGPGPKVGGYVKYAYGAVGVIPGPAGSSPADVNVDHLGRTLWSAADPETALVVATTMAAAQRMPSNRADPDWVTGDQLGSLALRAGQDYLTGLMVGAAVNAAVGSPFSAPAYGVANAAVGVVREVVPRLFGR